MSDDRTDTEQATPKVDGRAPTLRDLARREVVAVPARPVPRSPAPPPSPPAAPTSASPAEAPPPPARAPFDGAGPAADPGPEEPSEPGGPEATAADTGGSGAPVAGDPGEEEAAPAEDDLPLPPSPPFVADTAPYRWQVTLPSAIGRSLTLRVGPDVIELGGTEIPREEIARGTFKLEVEDALLRRAASARMRIEIERTDGSRVKVGARNAASAAKASAIIHTVTYLWALLGDVDGEEPASIVDRVRRGAEVTVGGVRFTSIGVAWKRDPIVTWSRLGDPELHGLDVVIPTDERQIVVPLTIDGSFMLPTLVPVLRRHFG